MWIVYHILACFALCGIALGLPPEKVAPVFAELTGNGYLEILEENGAFGLHLKG